MPVLKHAKKKLRQDKKRTERNRKVKETFRSLIKKAKVAKTVAALGAAFSSIDKAAKHHILEKNKAARMKSSLSKVVEGKGPAAAPKKAVVKKVAGKKVLAKKKSPAKKKK